MSAIKRHLEEVSERMGLGGEITDEVMEQAESEMAGKIDRIYDEKRGN